MYTVKSVSFLLIYSSNISEIIYLICDRNSRCGEHMPCKEAVLRALAKTGGTRVCIGHW